MANLRASCSNPLRKLGLFGLLFVLASASMLLGQSANPAPPGPVAVIPPEDPVHLETLRTYFDEIHYGSWLRRSWAAGYAEQKRQLPAWYPPAVWDAIVDAELRMDLAAVALPVYQKYMSEQACQYAIKLFATEEGQKLAAKMFAAQNQARAAGASADSAYEQALHEEMATENQTVARVFATVTPEDRRKMNDFMRSHEWMQIAGSAVEIASQLNAAELEQQKAIMHDESERHRDEIVAARKANGAGIGTSRPPSQ